MPEATSGPSPVLFFRTLNAYQQTAALKAALEMDLFTSIARGDVTPDALAQRSNVASRGVRILCDYLTVLGFLTKEGDTYGLTPDSAVFLDRNSPACIADAAGFLTSPAMMAHFRDLTGAVRRGGTVATQLGSIEPNHPMWVDFARGMAPMMQMPAELISRELKLDPSREWRILDIAAGHGVFGIALAKQAPLAQITAVDWPAVVEVARENAQRAGIADRFQTIPGSAFDVDYGDDYDIILLTNFLHHFDADTNVTLLRKVHAALKPGGRAVTLEFVPNADRVSPPEAATFSLTMLASTPAGDAYTFAELEEMFRNAGFADSSLIPLPPTPEQLVISTK